MALVAGAAVALSTGVGLWYFRGGAPPPGNEKEIKKMKDANKLPRGDLIKELQTMGRKKLKPVSERMLKKKEGGSTEFEQAICKIRSTVGLEISKDN